MAMFGNLLRRLTASAYETAGSGARSRAWRPASYGPNAALDGAGATLVNQSREMVRQNEIAAAAVERIVANVVGTGIKPQLTDPAAQELWLRWTDESAADGTLDFYGQQAQIMRAVVESGECFVRLRVRRPEDGLSVPLQIEVLEAEYCPMDLNRPAEGGGYIRQGVEFDRNVRSRRVAYWLYRQHPNDLVTDAVDTQPVRVPASEVLHIYWPGRPGQIRGEPWLARALAKLKDVREYDAAELVRKKTAAMMVGVVRRPVPEGVSEEELAELWGKDSGISGGVGFAGLEPGTVQFLEPGEEIEFSDPKDVGGQYEVFLRQQMRSIAASLGLLYEQLTGDFSQLNDRTWRAAFNEFKRRCELWQHHLMIFQFCRPVWNRWRTLAVIGGPATLPAIVRWTPPRWAHIHPLQDVQAQVMEIENGLASRAAIVSERGEDAAAVDAEQAADRAREQGLGLVYGAAPAPVQPDPAPDQTDQTDSNRS